MTTKTPFVTPFVSIRDFGAVPDDDNPSVQVANSKAVELAQDAMATPGQTWGHPIFVPSGTFYLAADLHVTKGLELFGTGYHGESVLEFAPGKSLIVDPGILLYATATLERVHVEGFTGTGIFIHGDPQIETNTNQWRLHDVRVEECGGHGIQTLGSECQGGLCTGAKVFVVGGNGIYETGGGNTYVGCYAEEIDFGRGYEADSPGQVTFVGCFAEAAKPTRLAGGGAVWVGGSSERSSSRLIRFTVDQGLLALAWQRAYRAPRQRVSLSAVPKAR